MFCKFGGAMNEVYNNIYQIDVTLPKSPLKLIHTYLIKGDKRNLLIDTGFNNQRCKDDLLQALYELNIDLDNTDIFLTHLHADHTGLVCSLLTGKNKVYCNDFDGKLMNSLVTENYKDIININLEITQTPIEKRLDYKDHPAIVNRMDHEISYIPILEGQVFEIGEYKFKVIDLSGHTPGQCGLYEENHKILFCGDHIINKITPNIIFWNYEMDSLQLFMDNLEKVKGMEIRHLYSAHRDVIANHINRIDEILLHHKNRLDEVINIIGCESKTVYEVAQKMTWDFGDGNFNSFDPKQVWFAVSEALAHVEHLRHKNILEKIVIDNEIRYKQKK